MHEKTVCASEWPLCHVACHGRLQFIDYKSKGTIHTVGKRSRPMTGRTIITMLHKHIHKEETPNLNGLAIRSRVRKIQVVMWKANLINLGLHTTFCSNVQTKHNTWPNVHCKWTRITKQLVCFERLRERAYLQMAIMSWFPICLQAQAPSLTILDVFIFFLNKYKGGKKSVHIFICCDIKKKTAKAYLT